MDQKTVDNILLYWLGVRNDETSAARFEHLSSTDWDRVIEQAHKHRITSLLYQRLKTISPDVDVPPSIAQNLREIYLHNMKRNVRLYHELSKVLRALQERDIPVIVLKGAALAEAIYQDIALRFMIDIDLLVKGRDIREADEVLVQSGYKPSSFPYSERHIDWERWIRHLSYVKGDTMIDIHAGIYELPDLDPWANARHATINSVDTLILGPEDFLLHLCLHLDHHIRVETGTLFWYYDIASLLKHYQGEFDWEYMMWVAREHQAESAAYRILHVIKQGFDELVPVNVMKQLKSDGITISIDDVLSPGVELKEKLRQSPLLSSWRLDFSRVPAVHNKLYHLFRKIFPCKRFMMLHYSISQPGLVYLYYLIRVCALVVMKPLKILRELPIFLRNKRYSRE